MKVAPADFYHPGGALGRSRYFVLGALLMAVKYNLDRLLYAKMLGRTWSPFDSEFVMNFLFRWSLYPQDSRQAAILAVSALPFLWIGVVLTLKRLRSAGLPLWLAVFFFLPVAKFLFFAALCVLPCRESAGDPARGRWDALLPASTLGSAVAAVVATFVPALVLGWLGTHFFENYAASLFMGIPFCQGFLAAIFHGRRERRSLGACIGVALLSITCAGAGFFAFAMEGIICLAMAAPLAAILAILGACLGCAVQGQRVHSGESGSLACVALLAMPGLMWLEDSRPPDDPLLKVVSAVDVAAPPERVWRNVVSFSDLPPPDEWIFRLGIAYPIRASIAGEGVGAIRRCEFSTGPFIEPIEVWDEPRLLKFSVTSNPAPMQEWTPYARVEPAHLHGFLVSEGGQFHLIPLPGGGTRLEGTTWYRHHMWPARYWQVWSDFLIHKIHLRVLRHVAQLSENEA